jgi:hypothetical protein
MTFEDLFPNLHRWVDLGNELRLGQESAYDAGSLVSCFDEGGTVYESPADETDLQHALELAEAAIGEWLDENDTD